MPENFRHPFFPTQLTTPGSPRMGSTFPQHFCLSRCCCCCFFFFSKQSIYVTKVQPDGPAAFGLVPGDRILEVGEYFWPYILSDQCCQRLCFNSDGVKSHNQKPRASWSIIKIRVPIPFTTLSPTIHVNARLGLDEYFRDAGLDEIHLEIRETLTGCGICQLPGEAGFAKIWAPMWGWERKRFSGWRRQKFGVRDSREKGSGSAGSGLPLPAPDLRGGRGTPLYKPYRFVLPQRVGFLSRFRLKTGRLRPFWSGMGYGFRHLRRPRGSQSGRLKGATKVNRPDWLSLSLRGWVFEGTTRTTGRYERIYRLNSKWVRKEAKICELEIGFSEIGSGFWELGDIPPPRISRSPPPARPFLWALTRLP